MKKLLIIFATITSLALGVATVLAQPVEITPLEPIKPETVTVELLQMPVIEMAELEPIVESTIIAPVVEQMTEQEKSDIIYDRFIRAADGGAQVMIFVKYNLKTNYPEKFTSENIHATLDYIDDYFPDNDINRVHYYIQNFHW